MQTFEILLALIAACVLLAVVAQRLNIPLAVALVLGGMALAFVPGLPIITLEPELALALFLPPLLQVSAYRTDWLAFKSSLRSILLLAIGAVFFTAAAVAIVAKLLLPDLPWWAVISLGAIVAPPDAVAAAAVLKQVALPKRIVTVLEGESLINDASSLVLYRFAVAATLAGSVSYGNGAMQFFGAAIGGTLIGWAVARAAMWIFSRLDDTLLDIAVSLLSGYAAYIAAEQVHASGVLAAVACGLMLGRHQHREFSAKTRLEAGAVWNFVEFLLTALVFMLIGLQLRCIVERLVEYDLGRLAILGGAISAALIVSRFLWVFPAVWLPRLVVPGLKERDPMPPWSHAVILSWAGMRGVVSLATALALPLKFPGRDIIIFLAFCAILATLVLQGTTLGWVIRRFGVADTSEPLPAPEAAQARAEINAAALDAVKAHVYEKGADEHHEAVTEVVQELAVKADRASSQDEQHPADKAAELRAQQELRLIGIAAAREKLNDHTDQVDVEAHRALAEELDLEEQQIRGAT